MLVCSWANVNALVQNKFYSTIHLLSQHLRAQSHQWKHQLSVWNLLKVNNKDTRLMSLTSFWCPHCQLQTHLISCSSVFSVSIVAFEQVKYRLSNRSHRFKKNRDLVLLLFLKNIRLIAVRGELRTFDTSKMNLFAKIVYSLKSLTILTRSPF